MLMMPLSVPSRPEKGPTDADDARHAQEGEFSRPARGPTDADDARLAADDARLAGFSRPGRGPTDADDALVGALRPRKGAN